MPKGRADIAELVTLRWNETSGVDHPANEEEGWLVVKAREEAADMTEEDVLAAITKEVEGEEAVQKESLYSITTGLEDASLWGKAPPAVKAALKTVTDHLHDLGYGRPERDTGKEASDEKPEGGEKGGALTLLKRLIGMAGVEKAAAEEAENDQMVERIVALAPGFIQVVKVIKETPASAEVKANQLLKAVEAFHGAVVNPEKE